MFCESQTYDKLEEASKQYVMKMDELKHGVGKLKNPKSVERLPLSSQLLYTFVKMF
jgi:hypothetical protein